MARQAVRASRPRTGHGDDASASGDLPEYASLRYSDIWNLQPSYRDLQVPWHSGTVRCTVWFGYANGGKCFFVEPHSAADYFLDADRLGDDFWYRGLNPMKAGILYSNLLKGEAS